MLSNWIISEMALPLWRTDSSLLSTDDDQTHKTSLVGRGQVHKTLTYLLHYESRTFCLLLSYYTETNKVNFPSLQANIVFSPLTNLLHLNSLSEFSPKAEMSLEKEQKTKEKDQFVDKSEVAYKYKFPIYSATQKIVLVNHTYYE